jgi:deoxycytidylate deaminase
MFMMFARAASMRMTCHRLNVGAIVVQDNDVVSIGYGGQPPGHEHCKGNDCPGIVPGKCNTIHAEVNALNKAANKVDGSVELYVTHSPCSKCLEHIMEGYNPVTKLYFETPYRETSHLEVLRHPYDIIGGFRKTSVYMVTPAGYIVEHFSRRVVEGI